MANLIFLILSVFDALAVLGLIFKLYRLPFWIYRYRILGFAIFIAAFSFTMRMVLGLEKFDLPCQYLFIVLFMRYALNIKTHLAAFTAGSGLTAYISLQMVMYYILGALGVPGDAMLFDNVGIPVYLVQIITILAAYAISFALYKTNWGFAFIIVPPHDFGFKENYFSSKNRILVVGSLISAISIITVIVFLYESFVIGIFAVSLITFGISYYFSERREYEDVREAIQKYRDKNKGS